MFKLTYAIAAAIALLAAAPAGAAPAPASAEHVAASGDTRRVNRALPSAANRTRTVFKVPARVSRMARVDQLMLRLALRRER